MQNLICIAIDGPDGVGKSTIIKKLVNYFNTNTSYTASSVSTSNTVLGLQVKQFINTHDNLPNSLIERLQIATLEYVSDYIVPNLEKECLTNKDKRHLLFIDRWCPSTGVYQSYLPSKGSLSPFCFNIPKQILNLPKLTIILNADDAILDERLYGREQDLEHYEKKEYQTLIREGYRAIANYKTSYPGYIQIDVNGTLDENFTTVLSKILKLI